MKNWFIKHREVLAYLVFGVLTTLLNIVLYALFSRHAVKVANKRQIGRASCRERVYVLV